MKIVLIVMSFILISEGAYALLPIREDVQDAAVKEQYQDVQREKRTIAEQMKAEKEQKAAENALLVERIKMKQLETARTAQTGKKGGFNPTLAFGLVLAVLAVAVILKNLKIDL